MSPNETNFVSIPAASVTAGLKQRDSEPLGIYVHVPFCASTCDFCAFYQKTPAADDIARYFSGLDREAALVDWPRRASTVFWGGGTPGLLSPRHLTQLGELVRARCGGG
ncbi:MAG: hypothetical protein ACREH8_09710, partial [Opitutaceae bacterium]